MLLQANEDLCKDGLRVNALCPAFADTALVRSLSDPSTSSNSEKAMAVVQAVGIMT